MTGTVVFLGAGATKALGGPLTSEILPEMLYGPNRGQPSTLLSDFVEELFHIKRDTPREQFPGLPLLMSLIDTALDRRQVFQAEWHPQKLSELRQDIETGLFELLETQLKRARTDDHWDLLSKIYLDPSEPRIVSTNYDLIIDTALMAFSEKRSHTEEGLLPDYRIPFQTPFYKQSNHFGILLKLHGSLNWLHCRTCQRMEIGASRSRQYVKVLGRLLDQPLENTYEDRSRTCESCGTVLRPLLIAPTHFKDYRNPHLAQVWYEAERVLREADKVIFIGYSLPDDDVEVVYLLKRGLAHLKSEQITVVEKDEKNPRCKLYDHSVGRRYRTLFGDHIKWHACGVNQWLEQYH